MIVNREFTGDTPIGMTFSSLAGSVGGGQQTPGFMGVGKVFLTSRKFCFAEGGHKRIIWMPKELKSLLAADFNRRFAEQGVPDLMDRIADETIATEPHSIREFMVKVQHPALQMEDMTNFAISAPVVKIDTVESPVALPQPARTDSQVDMTGTAPASLLTSSDLEKMKVEITASLRAEMKQALTQEIVGEIISVLGERFLGKTAIVEKVVPKMTELEPQKTAKTAEPAALASQPMVKASERIAAIKSIPIRREPGEVAVHTVKLGATAAEGGTRGRVYQIGGSRVMPFHLWEGEMPNRPLIAMEVFDSVSEKYPPVLREIYGDLLNDPARMAKACVEKYGADLISVRLEGTHPEKGNRSASQALDMVRSVLQAVDVPLIITGHSHFEKVNEVMKTVAQGCAGENLLLNWVEQDNYRTIAGTALGYGHTVVAQSPIDVNIGKQLNILLGNMDVKPDRIIMDPMTGAMGYGIEYTYSVMERIRLSGLGGDRMLACPMIVSPGAECAKIKEVKAAEKDFPAWGDLGKRAALWELTTAVSFLYAGADILILYHPEAVQQIKQTISHLMENA
jgi:acetyl-CoA decarbonylase/synthase, CODH/ACS complex subunit delta